MSWRETLNVGQLFMGNKSVQAKTYDVDFTVGAEAANVINVAVQLNDPEGTALSEVGVQDFYLSTDAAGLIPVTTAPSGGIAIGTDGKLIETVAAITGVILSDAVGKVDIDITEVGVFTFYLVLRLPMGGLAISSAIAFV